MLSKKELQLEYDEDGIIKNENYIKYYTEKNKIKSKYPPSLFKVKSSRDTPTENEVEEFRKYLKEITDLMFSADSHFQNFIWEMIPDYKVLQMERKINGRTNKSKITY